MENRKRRFNAVLNPNDDLKTPEKRVSSAGLLDTDYTRWGVDETCRYLQSEGLGKWEDKFRG